MHIDRRRRAEWHGTTWRQATARSHHAKGEAHTLDLFATKPSVGDGTGTRTGAPR